MTATLAHSADRVVAYLDFGTGSPPPEPVPEETAWWPFDETAVEAVTGKSRAATTPLPARWSPRPVRVLRRRFARSQFAADLRRWAGFVAFMSAVVVLLAAGDHLHQTYIHLFGGN